MTPLDGGAATRIPHTNTSIPIRWSADGKSLLAVELGSLPARVVRIDVATGRRELWKELGPPDLSGVIEIAPIMISADEKSYAYGYSSTMTRTCTSFGNQIAMSSRPVPGSVPTRSSARSAPGGMGEVYRAKDPRLGREVAIKVLPASFSQDADRLRRFEQEAKAAGVLNHPNITAVYDIGSHDGAPYVVQELLEGETLRAELAGGRFSPAKRSTTRCRSPTASPRRTTRASSTAT